MSRPDCPICGDAHACLACHFEGDFRVKAETSPAHRERIEQLWRQGPDPAPSPGLIARAATFAGAVVQHVAAGCPTVEPAEKARRLAICEACPHYDDLSGSCGICGCAMKLKAAWLLSRCPADPPRW